MWNYCNISTLWKYLKNRYNCFKSILIQNMGILLSVRKNFKIILKIIILNYYLICNHLRIFACQERVKSF